MCIRDRYNGDDGFWLLPNLELTGSQVHWIECTYKINLMGPGFMYMELDGQNCIDETSPYNVSAFTLRTNETNGIVNSSLAKFAVPTTPISQWFDMDRKGPYKYWNPPAERLFKIKVKLRYHNGIIAQMGLFDYSFMLELSILKPQQERIYSIVNSDGLSQKQKF